MVHHSRGALPLVKQLLGICILAILIDTFLPRSRPTSTTHTALRFVPGRWISHVTAIDLRGWHVSITNLSLLLLGKLREMPPPHTAPYRQPVPHRSCQTQIPCHGIRLTIWHSLKLRLVLLFRGKPALLLAMAESSTQTRLMRLS